MPENTSCNDRINDVLSRRLRLFRFLLSLTHVFQRQARRMTHIFNDGGSRSVTRVYECTCLRVKAEIDHLPSVTNDNLGGVLVGHNNGRGR